MKNDKSKCGANTKAGGKCKNPAGFKTSHPGEGRCHLHGGGTPRGADSPHFKHGIYSDYLPESWRQKAETMQGTLDLLPELQLTRAILAEFMERFAKIPGWPVGAEDIEVMRALIDLIRKLTDSMVKQRNNTALTAAEIALLADRIPQLVVKYVEGIEKQRAFIAELFSITGSGGEGPDSAQLPSGVIAHPGRTD
jgi:hypothetical protein